MDKSKILRLCNDIEDYATEIRERTMSDSYHLAQIIIDKVLKIAAEISEKPKSNADRIRQMTDEQLAEWLDTVAGSCSLQDCKYCPMCGACTDVPISMLRWLRKEADEDVAERTH